jgi:hypothetical protein
MWLLAGYRNLFVRAPAAFKILLILLDLSLRTTEAIRKIKQINYVFIEVQRKSLITFKMNWTKSVNKKHNRPEKMYRFK